MWRSFSNSDQWSVVSGQWSVNSGQCQRRTDANFFEVHCSKDNLALNVVSE
jgi:hypothetical protein